MNRVIKIYKVSFLIEIVLGFIGLCSYIYYKPSNLLGIIQLLFICLSIVTSLVIGIKSVIATEKCRRLKEELNIVGHIANSIKLIAIILLIIGGLWFFSNTIQAVNSVTTRSMIYYSAMLLFSIWIVTSLFNFFAYILIVRMNKKVLFLQADNIGIDTPG